ncbi:MAG: tRNA (adenosine(37)-N6)-threonylcarbamoyltransferase complex dimerization subunit type 1 TsaB [Pelosinus sp.]|nr:tRNA (adenosine(37)-N6)-threonylcarbamoyltransferase complex dimerization subunit type 1 TsaB [Pelosinus sp.]
MLILALDTATLVSSVALVEDNKLIAELTLQTKKNHSELLMPNIKELLSIAEKSRTDLTAIAVSIGPGSFTGLRIGLATAKALAYALSIPIIGIPTLTAQAFACPVPGAVYSPLLDAQKGNVYQALFVWQGGELIELEPATVVSFAAALDKLAKLNQPAVVLGEGAIIHAQEIINYGGNVFLAPPHVVIARAGCVGLCAYELLGKGKHDDLFLLEPLYIRRSEAEELWEKRHPGCL